MDRHVGHSNYKFERQEIGASVATPRSVICYAVTSRILLTVLIIFWRNLFNPYDSSASLNPSCISASPPSGNETLVWPSTASSIERSIVWDGVYFVRIAQCGYEYEQSYAFFPLFPLSMSILSQTVFYPLISYLGERAVLALSGYFLNSIAFVFSACFFYRLSEIILLDQELAWRASVLFCFNPASVFYSSIYSESLYAFFTFGGLYLLISGAKNWSVLWFALSASARSNGALNAGYILFHGARKAYYAISCRDFALGGKVIVADSLRCLCVFSPFMMFQAYGYYNLCFLSTRETLRPWCHSNPPFVYDYVQSHYWGVGFLRYFRIPQIPNFLLASPMLSLSVFSLAHYYLGFFCRTSKSKYFSVPVLPFVLHLSFLTATALFVMHVQVATRFLSSCPSIYWFSSYVMSRGGRFGYIIWTYFIAFILVGTLLFSNFYPFT